MGESQVVYGSLPCPTGGPHIFAGGPRCQCGTHEAWVMVKQATIDAQAARLREQDAEIAAAKAWSARWKQTAMRYRRMLAIHRDADPYRRVAEMHLKRLRDLEEIDKEHANCSFDLKASIAIMDDLGRKNIVLTTERDAALARVAQLEAAIVRVLGDHDHGTESEQFIPCHSILEKAMLAAHAGAGDTRDGQE